MPFPEYITAEEHDRRLDEESLACQAEMRGRPLTDDERAEILASNARRRAETRAEFRAQCAEMRALAFENDTALLNASEDERELHRLRTERICAEVAGRFGDVRAMDREIEHIRARIAKSRRAA